MIPDIHEANEARERARRLRAKWRLALSSGSASLAQFLEVASTPGGRPLRSVLVVDVLSDAYGMGAARSRRIVEKVVDVSGARIPKRLDVAWLLDSRSAGRRVLALCDEMTPLRGGRPWEGFPWAPQPHDKEDDEWGL